MNILITGGAGYLGTMLTAELLMAGHNVTVYDNLMYGQRDALLPLCQFPGFKFVLGDVRRNASYIAYIRGAADVIIPLAAIVGAPACEQHFGMASDINHMAVAQLCSEVSPNQMLIYPNTNSGYGNTEGVCTEETPMKPVSGYGNTKCAAERSVLASGGISLRLATLFGISYRMRLDLLVNDFVHRAWRDKMLVLYEPHYRRNFLHVRDAARCFLFMIENYDKYKGQAFNVGLSNANLTKMELADRITKVVPGTQVICQEGTKDPDQRNYTVSNAKIEATGWKPAFSLDDGIAELVRACQVLNRLEYCNA